MTRLEKFVVNSPFRTLMQRVIPTPFFSEYGSLPPEPFCLEIGCGQGAGAEIILKKFKAGKVVALDYDPEEIQLAKKRAHTSNISLLVGDAANLSFSSNQFDAVFNYGILHHVADWRQALAEIYRVLKPGGCLFYEDITKILLRTYMFAKFFPHSPVGYFTQQEFEQVLIQVGFELSCNFELFNSYLLGVARKPGSAW